MDFFLKRCHKSVFACSTVSSYNIRYKDWEKTCPKGVLLKKIFASFMIQKLWRFDGFAHIHIFQNSIRLNHPAYYFLDNLSLHKNHLRKRDVFTRLLYLSITRVSPQKYTAFTSIEILVLPRTHAIEKTKAASRVWCTCSADPRQKWSAKSWSESPSSRELLPPTVIHTYIHVCVYGYTGWDRDRSSRIINFQDATAAAEHWPMNYSCGAMLVLEIAVYIRHRQRMRRERGASDRVVYADTSVYIYTHTCVYIYIYTRSWLARSP